MVSPPANNPWLLLPRLNPTARFRLFCFPYAGGNASLFKMWPRHLPANVELFPIQLPGKGKRMTELPFIRISQIVEALASALFPYMDKPCAFFGHSMGAMISFELTRKLRKLHGFEPRHLFVSGRCAPQWPARTNRTYDLPEEEFMCELRELNGTPREVLEHAELMQLLLPQLRADFEAVETYEYRDEPPLSCGIDVFGGVGDRGVKRESLEAWRAQTTGPFSLTMLPGDHFFIHPEEQLFLHALSKKLHRLTSMNLS